jgi:hypothetical protein
MYPETGDYQGDALFGSATNNSTLTADMLNPAASGPNDWTTILTNGISGAAINGINGAINNAIQAGQLQNVATAQGLGLGARQSMNPTTLLLLGVVLFVVLR